MSIIQITTEKALSLIEAAVAERGAGWAYPDTGTCRYMYDPEYYARDDEDYVMGSADRAMVAYFGDTEQPACLVGLVLHNLDQRLDQVMWEQNEQSVDGWMGEHGVLTVDVDSYEFPYATVKVLQAAQSAQDIGLTWGAALERAQTEAAKFEPDEVL